MERMAMQEFEMYYRYIPAVVDIKYRLLELVEESGMERSYTAIIPGLQELCRRGDTVILRELLEAIVKKGVTRNTRAAQLFDAFIESLKDVDSVTYRFAKEKFPNLWG